MTKRGGKRAGAGSPPLGGKGSGESRNIVVRLPADMHDMLDALSKQCAISKSNAARAAIKHGIDSLIDKKKEET